MKDSLIAATALAHNLLVATRNATDFRHAGVRLENPFVTFEIYPGILHA